MPRILRPLGSGGLVLFCDHASNHIPVEFNQLGLPTSELSRHIAWDIGAAGVTEALSEIFDAPAILCGTSRLVIDCNRQLHDAGLIPEVSDGTVIYGNLQLSDEAKAERVRRWFDPYHEAVESVFLEREDRGAPTIAISIHSMTASLGGVARPWQVSISSHVDRRLTDPMLASLRRTGDITVGDNQPYNLDPTVDYSTPLHALRREMAHLQLEVRQDQISDAPNQQRWARRLAQSLREVV
jgi:predicted N-formylglutamate amidohydrolase